jgi:co-chaperonin GroES (HSP10)
MKGTNNFIIKLENPYSETFKTKGGLELYGNVDFTAEEQSNRVAEVISVPSLFETEIDDGYEVLIDATPIYRQIYNGTKQWYQNVVDEDENLYHLTSDMIICYRENKNSEWKGFLENSLVKPIMKETKVKDQIKTSLIITETERKPEFSGKVNMTYSNTELKKHGVKEGDTLFMDIRGGVKYWFEGIEYWWVRNRDLFAIAL